MSSLQFSLEHSFGVISKQKAKTPQQKGEREERQFFFEIALALSEATTLFGTCCSSI